MSDFKIGDRVFENDPKEQEARTGTVIQLSGDGEKVEVQWDFRVGDRITLNSMGRSKVHLRKASYGFSGVVMSIDNVKDGILKIAWDGAFGEHKNLRTEHVKFDKGDLI